MLNKITITLFNALAVAVAVGAAFWLAMAGRAFQLDGLMVAMGAMLGAMVFSFRLSEGAEAGRLSIWAGPLGRTGRRTS
jgi:hypothetical protein